MSVKVYKVEPRMDYVIRVTFFNGVVNDVKIGEWAKYDSSLGEVISIKGMFESVKVNSDKMGVSWINDASIHTDELYNSGVLVERVNIEEAAVRFGERLYSYRTFLNMTQKELEEKSGIHQADISKYEKGEGNPSVKTMQRLAEAMGAKIDISKGYIFNRPYVCNVPLSAAVAAYVPAGKVQGEYVVDDLAFLPDDVRVEIINGVIYDMATPNVPHQQIIGYIYYKVRSYIEQHQGSEDLISSPFGLFFDDERNYLEPDLAIVCNPKIIKKKGVLGAPDFILEVCSPGNAQYDLSTKLSVYQKLGVKEYWIIHPMKRYLVKYLLQDENPPQVFYLDQKVPIDTLDGKCVIDLKEIAEIIDRYVEDE